MTILERIKSYLNDGESDAAITLCDKALTDASLSGKQHAIALYLQGNAWRQKGDWKRSLNCYLASIDLYPDGPAALAYRQAQEILNFYNKDLYNP